MAMSAATYNHAKLHVGEKCLPLACIQFASQSVILQCIPPKLEVLLAYLIDNSWAQILHRVGWSWLFDHSQTDLVVRIGGIWHPPFRRLYPSLFFQLTQTWPYHSALVAALAFLRDSISSWWHREFLIEGHFRLTKLGGLVTRSRQGRPHSSYIECLPTATIRHS